MFLAAALASAAPETESNLLDAETQRLENFAEEAGIENGEIDEEQDEDFSDVAAQLASWRRFVCDNCYGEHVAEASAVGADDFAAGIVVESVAAACMSPASAA